MTSYAVVAFPETDAITAIEALRRRYDPLAAVLGAHVTVVFPFDDATAAAALRQHLEQSVAGLSPIDLTLGGVSIEHGEYLFLNVDAGADRIAALHRTLYGGLLAPHWSLEHSYRPHITLGRIADAGRLDAAASEARATLPARSSARIAELSVFRLDGAPNGHVLFTIPLPATYT